MNLNEKVSINTRYTRSINLERDADSAELSSGYVLTSRALHTIERYIQSLGTGQAPRAWSLVGPYGSGKSSLLLFLSQLLSNENTSCLSKLASEAPLKATTLEQHLADSCGYLSVLVTGTYGSLTRYILDALKSSLERYFSKNKIKSQKVIQLLSDVSEQEIVSSSDVIYAIQAVQKQLAKSKKLHCPGILICIDELGKFLEYEALQSEANDIYLLQELAELACSEDSIHLNLFVSLHHSLEHYAKGLGETLKHEWSKVQGRFEEIPFLESSEQTLRVVSKAIQQSFTSEESESIHNLVAPIVDVLYEEKALPHGLDATGARELFLSCYPLHPLTALILPVLCQKLAQNERTLFSYLSSHEEHGFRDIVAGLETNAFVMPADIYNYFMSSQAGSFGDHSVARKWVEVSSALDRFDPTSKEDVQVLKTIGLLNIIGSRRGLKASKAILSACYTDSLVLQSALVNLEQSSVVHYRKFNSEYRVWQGSDFDLEDTLQDEVSKIRAFSVSEALNMTRALGPIVARRYTIENGALRYFSPVFLDSIEDLKSVTFDKPSIAYIFCNTLQEDIDGKYLEKECKSSEFALISLNQNSQQLTHLLIEQQALAVIEKSYQELNSDPIAKRQLKERVHAVEKALHRCISQLYDTPQKSIWFWKGKKLSINSKRELQETFSRVLESIYCNSPAIHNELINRDKPSSQAVAGRNKLLVAMHDYPKIADLNIQKFPPEKAIYRAVLKETGLHREMKGELQFAEPTEESELYETWKAIRDFFSQAESKPVSLDELAKILLAPPLGVKEGLLPILFYAAFIIDRHELAIYEDRKYVPCLQPDHLERLSRKPGSFSVQRFRVDGIRASIYEEYSKALFRNKKQRTVIQLIAPLTDFLQDLPEYTQKTKSSDLSIEAQRVRSAFQLAKSPEVFLFEDLPKALGYDVSYQTNDKELVGFSDSLQNVLRELKHAYPKLIEHQKELLGRAFQLSYDDIEELRRNISGRYTGLDQYTVDTDGLKAFLMRLTKRDGDDESWLQNILMFLGHKPAAKWTDTNRAEAEVRLSDYSKRILDLETLRVHHDRHLNANEDDFEVYLLKSLKKGAEPIDKVITVDKHQHKAIQDIKGEVISILNSGKMDQEVQLAVIAELVDELLSSRDTPERMNVKEVSNGK